MGVSVVAGAIAATFINLDKVSRFKGAGFEAEMRKAVEDVYATIETIEELSKPLVYSIYSLLIGEGFFGGLGADKKYEVSQKLDDIIASFDLEDKEIKQIHNMFNKTIVKEYFDEFVGSLSYDYNFKQKLYELCDRDIKFPAIEQIENFFQQNNKTINDISLVSKEKLKKYLKMKKDLV